MKKPYIIAIAGGSGSGKTYLAQMIHQELGDSRSCIICQDNYYVDQSSNFDYDGGSVNFDHPDAIDFALLAKHLKELKNNNDVQVPTYHFASHSRSSATITHSPKEVILVEGILLLTNPAVREIADETIFVDTPEKVRFKRRLERDVLERKRTPEGVKAQFESHVRPMHDEFVETSKIYAMYISSGTEVNSFYSTVNRVCANFFN